MFVISLDRMAKDFQVVFCTDTKLSGHRKTTSRSLSRQLILLAAVNRSISHQQVVLDKMTERAVLESQLAQAGSTTLVGTRDVECREKEQTDVMERHNDSNGNSDTSILTSAFSEVEQCVYNALMKIEDSCRKFHQVMTA